MIESVRFESSTPGRNTLVLGSIHGNETCGSIAIDQYIDQFRSDVIKLISGSITFLPRANRQAYRVGRRYIDHDLNRSFGSDTTGTEEHRTAQLIKKFIGQSDFVLDLHSIHAGDTPFAFLESKHHDAASFVKSAPLPFALTGWEELYRSEGTKDTIAYAESLGIPGVTVECGLHTSISAVEVANRMIHFTLNHFGHIEGNGSTRGNADKKYIRIENMVRRPHGAGFVRNWENFDAVNANTLIGTAENHSNFVAPHDGHIIIPNPNGKHGDEWYYFGSEQN